jgi:hypothetical protein
MMVQDRQTTFENATIYQRGKDKNHEAVIERSTLKRNMKQKAEVNVVYSLI